MINRALGVLPAWTETESSTFAGSGSSVSGQQGAALASASTVALTDFYHIVSGTVQVNTLTYTGAYPALFVIHPSGAFPIGTGGNIVNAPATAVVGADMQFVYDGTNFTYQAAGVAGYVPSLAASKITSGQLALARGGTNADLSATGAANSVLKQSSAGAAITVATLTAGDIPLTWTTPTFDANAFTASGSQTWTVEAADRATFEYATIGKTMFFNCQLNTTTVGGTPATQLIIALPNSAIAAKSVRFPCIVNDNNGGFLHGIAALTATSNSLVILRASLANWTNSANLTYVDVGIAFEIQ